MSGRCHFSFFAKSAEKEPLLMEAKGQKSSEAKIKTAFKHTKEFRNTCKELGEALFQLFRGLDQKKERLSWFSRHLCYHPWLGISNDLYKIKKLNQKLFQLGSSYKSFVLTATSELTKTPTKELADLVAGFRSDLTSPLGDRFRGAKVLCEPTYFRERIENLDSSDQDSPAAKLLRLLNKEECENEKRLEQQLKQIDSGHLSKEDLIGEFDINPTYRHLTPVCRLRLNEILFDTAYNLFKIHEEGYMDLLGKLHTIYQKASEAEEKAAHRPSLRTR